MLLNPAPAIYFVDGTDVCRLLIADLSCWCLDSEQGGIGNLIMAAQVCVHIDAISDVKLPKKRVCEECVKTGSQWLHLRTCQECGTTLCCDSSPNKHATKHARASGHPVIASGEPGERWLYCYPDDAFVEY